jgi:hypothetical protein
MADLIAAELQSGWAALRRTAAAETCGHDMDVPDMMLYCTTRWSPSSFVGGDASLHAARMFSPGAVMSGCIDRGHRGNQYAFEDKRKWRGMCCLGNYEICTYVP